MGFNAESVDFSNFTPVLAEYGPRDIKAVAAMVTRHNIGQWALEFEKDLVQDDAGMPCFTIAADREGDDDITLKIEIDVWLVKVWNELHLFRDGMFQKTFAVPKEQLQAVRKIYRDKEIQLEKEWQEAREAERRELDAEMEEKFQIAQESGDWSNLSKGEKYVLRQRLMEDEEFKAIVEAARLRKASEKMGENVGGAKGILDASGVKKLNEETEQTQIVPAAGRLDPLRDYRRKVPHPTTGETVVVTDPNRPDPGSI